MKTPSILFLHGPSSSGKTTLAHALQHAAPVPLWHLSIDHFRDSGAWPMSRFRHRELDWTQHRAAFFDGFHRAVAASASAGNHLILEHILDDDSWGADLKALFVPFDVVFVGLTCSLDDLIRREHKRGDRPTGSAAEDYATVHANRTYDLMLDGTSDSRTNAQTVLEYWQAGTRISEFARENSATP